MKIWVDNHWILVLVITVVKSMKMIFPRIVAPKAMKTFNPLNVIILTVRVKKLSVIFLRGTAPQSIPLKQT